MIHKSPYSRILAIATFLLLPLSGMTAFSAEEEAKPADKKVIVKFERYGGFAGFHDKLTIHDDFTYVLDTPRHVKHHFKGSISAEHQKELTEILKGYGTFLKEQSDGPKVADGMRTRTQVNGTAADKDAKGDERALSRLLHQITMEARKGERVDK